MSTDLGARPVVDTVTCARADLALFTRSAASAAAVAWVGTALSAAALRNAVLWGRADGTAEGVLTPAGSRIVTVPGAWPGNAAWPLNAKPGAAVRMATLAGTAFFVL